MEQRAKELMEILASPQILSLAVKYASKLGRIHLAERLNEMSAAIEAQEQNDLNNFDDDMREEQNVSHNIMQNALSSASIIRKSKENAVQITPVSFYMI